MRSLFSANWAWKNPSVPWKPVKTLPGGEKDPNTSSMRSCSCLQIETGKVKMFPRNIHTFLGQNCSSNRWLQKLDVLFASLTEIQEVERQHYEHLGIVYNNWIDCSVQSAVGAVCPKSQPGWDGRNSSSCTLLLSLMCTHKRAITGFSANETTKINQVQIQPVQETMDSAGSEALG